jgi:hypothetical protein
MSPRTGPLHPWTRVNLVLAALLVGLLAWEWSSTRPDPQGALLLVDPEQVDSIRVESGPRLKLALQRDADGWRITHPADRSARPERVAQLLAVVRAPVRYRFAAPPDLDRYGLGTPAAALHLDGSGMSPVTLAFGDRDPAQNQRYVLADGEIRLVDEVFFSLLSLPTDHFTAD